MVVANRCTRENSDNRSLAWFLSENEREPERERKRGEGAYLSFIRKDDKGVDEERVPLPEVGAIAEHLYTFSLRVAWDRLGHSAFKVLEAPLTAHL